MGEKFNKIKNKTLHNVKKVKHVRWLIPGWVYYQYYKTSKSKGSTRKQAHGKALKAEALRLAATFSFPVPGTYELSTLSLALIDKKIKNNEIKVFTLKEVKENIVSLKGKPYGKNKIIRTKIKAKEFFNKHTEKRLRKYKF